MNIYNISTLFFAFTTLLLGLMVLLKRQDDVGKSWFVFSLVVGIWGTAFCFQLDNRIPYEKALFLIRIQDAVGILIPAIWLRFVYSFLELKIERKLFIPIYLVTLLLVLSTPTPYFIRGLKDKSHLGVVHYEEGGIFFHGFTVLFFAVVVFAFFKIVMALRAKDLSRERRTQIKYLVAATAFGFLGAGLAFLPIYDVDFPILYGILLMPLFPFLTTLAIIRHRLLDMEQLAYSAQRDKLAVMGILAASINHEIRNPLYIIRATAESHLQNLKDGVYGYRDHGELVEKSNKILEKAIEQSDRAMDIMRRFALFAKEGTTQEARIESVCLSEILEGILPLVRCEFELEKIELVHEIPDDLRPIQADRRQIEEIFFNLMVNACQAMKGWGGKLTIRAEEQADSVRIEIEDNGRGISRDQLPKIFEPFYTTKESGTGLGLYITRQFVERNKGRISVESQLGKGTRFILNFPLATEFVSVGASS